MSAPSAGKSSSAKSTHTTGTRAGSLVLGVDGGGTKTKAWLAKVDEHGTPQVLGGGVAGSSNQVAVGYETAFANLASSIDRAFADASLTRLPVARAVLALAGSGTIEVQRRVLDFIQQNQIAESARVVHDGLAVLQAVAANCRGIALIAGTGAVAYGRNLAGKTAVVGGWGYWFGDEGSAFWLGQTALRAISQAADGRAAQTALTAAVLKRLNIQAPRDILTALSGAGDVRLGIASLADLTCKMAEQQDEVALQILKQAAAHWCSHVTSLAEKLMPGERFPLALAGGVLTGNSLARELLSVQLEAAKIPIAALQCVDDPVAGCLQLACDDLAEA